MLRGALRSPEGVDFDLRLEEKLDLGTEYDWVHLAGSWQQGPYPPPSSHLTS